MKFISIGRSVINLDKVDNFEFVGSSYDKSSKLKVYYSSGKEEEFSQTQEDFNNLRNKMYNFNILIH